jgi:hypothetical protein
MLLYVPLQAQPSQRDYCCRECQKRAWSPQSCLREALHVPSLEDKLGVVADNEYARVLPHSLSFWTFEFGRKCLCQGLNSTGVRPCSGRRRSVPAAIVRRRFLGGSAVSAQVRTVSDVRKHHMQN